jgi:DNA primase
MELIKNKSKIKAKLVKNVLSKVSLVELVQSRLSLKRKAKNFIGLCPFHSETKPSFFVYPDSQKFLCLGCGASGDAIDFCKLINMSTWYESLILLGDHVSIDVKTQLTNIGYRPPKLIAHRHILKK